MQTIFKNTRKLTKIRNPFFLSYIPKLTQFRNYHGNFSVDRLPENRASRSLDLEKIPTLTTSELNSIIDLFTNEMRSALKNRKSYHKFQVLLKTIKDDNHIDKIGTALLQNFDLLQSEKVIWPPNDLYEDFLKKEGSHKPFKDLSEETFVKSLHFMKSYVIIITLLENFMKERNYFLFDYAINNFVTIMKSYPSCRFVSKIIELSNEEQLEKLIDTIITNKVQIFSGINGLNMFYELLKKLPNKDVLYDLIIESLENFEDGNTKGKIVRHFIKNATREMADNLIAKMKKPTLIFESVGVRIVNLLFNKLSRESIERVQNLVKIEKKNMERAFDPMFDQVMRSFDRSEFGLDKTQY